MVSLKHVSNGEARVTKWYFGGLASAAAACVTHPLDLLKVQMQTQKGKNISMMRLIGIVVKNQGVLGLYNGISASLLRQLSYSTARFGIYETAKQAYVPKGEPISFLTSISLAGLGGVAGGLVGNPADLVNVRMQNDMKLPPKERRNYKNAVHGMYRVVTKEGFLRLWSGATMNCCRAALMTIGQLSFYDQIKPRLLATPYFIDNVVLHVVSSLLAGAVATTMTQPIDVIKTRIMNAKPGEKTNIMTLIYSTAKESPVALFKGYIPAFSRLAPHTVLTFVFLEQLRLNFGTVVRSKPIQ